LNSRPADYESLSNLNEPKPPNVILSIFKNLRFGGLGVFRLIFGDLRNFDGTLLTGGDSHNQYGMFWAGGD
jgi:hypothetical protein